MKIVMSEMIEEAAQCSFGDIAGQKLAKQALQEGRDERHQRGGGELCRAASG